MHVIRVRNVHRALPAGLRYLSEVGIPAPSRNGEVIVAPGPVTTVYDRPAERVLFWPGRDANPFFHLFESLWMLAGRDDVAFLTRFVQRFEEYSDDGATLNGAYGQRWRYWPIETSHDVRDQIERVVELMLRDPGTRRAVIEMWDPNRDLFPDQGKDVCCNTHLYLRTSLGKRDEPNRLNLTVCCRSNDAIWGAHGANAVHFSMLQEYVAARLGLVVGTLYQVSNDYHAYKAVYDKTVAGLAADDEPAADPYTLEEVKPYPLVAHPADWEHDLSRFMHMCDACIAFPNGVVHPIADAGMYHDDFFAHVARPMWWAHVAFKRGAFTQAFEILAECRATDWKRAAWEWLERRRAGRPLVRG
jgi:hypothetical protein